MRMAENAVPEEWAEFLTERQSTLMAKLDAEKIPWIFQDTAGGCNALVVMDSANMRQVVITNCDDDIDNGDIFVVDAHSSIRECALFGLFEEVWGDVLYTSNDLFDFMNIARYLTAYASDPYEHVLHDGRRVTEIFQ